MHIFCLYAAIKRCKLHGLDLATFDFLTFGGSRNYRGNRQFFEKGRWWKWSLSHVLVHKTDNDTNDYESTTEHITIVLTITYYL